MFRIGVFGLQCTKTYNFSNFKILPFYSDRKVVKKLSNDKHYYHLTAFLEIDDCSDIKIDSFIFDLEAVLSFVEQRDVIIRHPLRLNEDYHLLEEDFPQKIEGYNRRQQGSGVIFCDEFYYNSKINCISLAMEKLKSNSETDMVFRSSFFKTIEVFRARDNFIDISYYLLFSALESLCRSIANDYSRNCAPPMMKVLSGYGFDIKQESLNEPYNSLMTYIHLRNALFHNGKLEKEVDGILYTQNKYYSPFSKLVPLVLLKYIGFDDKCLNWNSWLDRMQFLK